MTVHTKDGGVHEGRVDDPNGDPGNTLSRAELEHKTLTLGSYGHAASEDEIHRAIEAVWSITESRVVPTLLPALNLESCHA